jgi:hypothetical protein
VVIFDRNNVLKTLTLEKTVATGYEFVEEGMCAVRTLEGGVERIIPSSGTTGEAFVGFNIIRNLTPKSESVNARYEVPFSSPYYLKLQYNNLFLNQLRVIDIDKGYDSSYGTLTFITVGQPLLYSQILVDYTSGILTFHPDLAGDTVHIYYRHQLTINQSILKYLQRMQKDNIDPEVYNQVGIYANYGIIYTDQYDMNKDYNNVARGQLKTGPNGLVTVGGGGDCVGAVIKTPAIDYPYLGIEYRTH